MSTHQPHLLGPLLLRLTDRFARTGARSAVVTPFKRTSHSQVDEGDVNIGWDLIRSEHRVRAAGARLMHLFGEVLSFDGHPVQNAVLEIRQCDMYGRTPAEHSNRLDFSGIGRTVTDFEGRYQFRTILPVPDTTGSAHIDARITLPTGKQLSTRLYLLNNSVNELDWNYLSLGPSRQAAVSLDPVERADGDLDAGFNFVL